MIIYVIFADMSMGYSFLLLWNFSLDVSVTIYWNLATHHRTFHLQAPILIVYAFNLNNWVGYHRPHVFTRYQLKHRNPTGSIVEQVVVVKWHCIWDFILTVAFEYCSVWKASTFFSQLRREG
ncbi:hypothetical protein C8Q75DRAFT_330503 [Abortiporus biennis]|nr:hypothetical protein C8Q75DRAFT_330503 [Abortiporus biennis]